MELAQPRLKARALSSPSVSIEGSLPVAGVPRSESNIVSSATTLPSSALSPVDVSSAETSCWIVAPVP